MLEFKIFELSIEKVVMRYYLMMAVVIISGFLGVWPLAILALPIFISTILGIKFETASTSKKIEGKVIKMTTQTSKSKAS